MTNYSDINYLKELMKNRKLLKEKYPGFLGRHLNYTNNSNKINYTLELIGKDNKKVYNIGEEFVKIREENKIDHCGRFKTVIGDEIFNIENEIYSIALDVFKTHGDKF
tara:strand:+ start:399 stop:722 length:324 start_codon:yes stop_codon:yes gene_type:complete